MIYATWLERELQSLEEEMRHAEYGMSRRVREKHVVNRLMLLAIVILSFVCLRACMTPLGACDEHQKAYTSNS